MLQKVVFHSLAASGEIETDPVGVPVSGAYVDVILSSGPSERNVFDLTVETLVSDEGNVWRTQDTTRLSRALGDSSPIHVASRALVSGKLAKSRLSLGQSVLAASIVLTWQ